MKIYEFGHATFIWGKTTEHLDDAIAVINKAESPEKEQEIAISGRGPSELSSHIRPVPFVAGLAYDTKRRVHANGKDPSTRHS